MVKKRGKGEEKEEGKGEMKGDCRKREEIVFLIVLPCGCCPVVLCPYRLIVSTKTEKSMITIEIGLY